MNMFVRIVELFLIAEGHMKELMNKLIAYHAIAREPGAHFQECLFIMKKDQFQHVYQKVQAALVDLATLAIIKGLLIYFTK
jgi:hypothetical protein